MNNINNVNLQYQISGEHFNLITQAIPVISDTINAFICIHIPFAIKNQQTTSVVINHLNVDGIGILDISIINISIYKTSIVLKFPLSSPDRKSFFVNSLDLTIYF